MSRVGGFARKELKVTSLRCCRRFPMAYYCSKECQTKQWHTGHKNACRKNGQLEKGDLMVIKGLVEKPEMNNIFVTVVDPIKDSNRWKVQVTKHFYSTGLNEELHGKFLSVAADNLFRTRPSM